MKFTFNRAPDGRIAFTSDDLVRLDRDVPNGLAPRASVEVIRAAGAELVQRARVLALTSNVSWTDALRRVIETPEGHTLLRLTQLRPSAAPDIGVRS